MLTAPNQRLLEWVRKFRADLTPEGTITRIELFHSIEGEMGERLATFEMADRDEDEDPDDLAQEIWNEAEEDSAVRPLGSIQRYVVQAYRGDTREPDEQKAFTTQGRLSTGLTGNGSEPPTSRGEMMAERRYQNDLHAMMMRMAEATAGTAAVQLQREREENNRLREVSYKYEQLRQDLLDRAQDRELARKDAEATAELNRLLISTGLQFLPMLLQRVLSPPAPPGASLPLHFAPPPQPPAGHAHTAAADAPPHRAPPEASASSIPPTIKARDAAVADLLGSVSPTQLQGLLATFSQEQVAKFLEIYSSFRDSPPEPVVGPPQEKKENTHVSN